MSRCRLAYAEPMKGTIIFSTTTSIDDSGLLTLILPAFTAETRPKSDVFLQKPVEPEGYAAEGCGEMNLG